MLEGLCFSDQGGKNLQIGCTPMHVYLALSPVDSYNGGLLSSGRGLQPSLTYLHLSIAKAVSNKLAGEHGLVVLLNN